MSQTLVAIQSLAARGEYRFSRHALEELEADGILPLEVVHGIQSAVVVEDYPEHRRGPCVLVLCRGEQGEPIHAVWGLQAGTTTPAVLVTAYRPDPAEWSPDFLRRST